MPESFLDVEQVIKFVLTLDRDNLEIVRREVEAHAAKLEDDLTDLHEIGEGARSTISKNEFARRTADYSEAARKQLEELKNTINTERQELRKASEEANKLRREGAAEDDKNLRDQLDAVRSRAKAVETAEENYRKAMATANEELKARIALMREEAKAAGIPIDVIERAIPASMRETETRPQYGPVTREEDAKERERKERDRISSEERRLTLLTGRDEYETMRQLRRATTGGRLMDQAFNVGSLVTGQAGGFAGAGTGGMVEMGASITKFLAGMTNPVNAIVEVVGSIKTILWNMYLSEMQARADQAKVIAGSPEAVRRAVHLGQDVTGGGLLSSNAVERLAEESIQTRRLILGNVKTTQEEAEALEPTRHALGVGAPGFQTGKLAEMAPAFEAVVAIHRQSGMKMEEAASFVAEVARKTGTSDAAGVMQAAQQVQELNITAVRMAQQMGNIDPSILQKHMLDLSKQFMSHGGTVEEATRVTMRFAKELEDGRVKANALFESMFRAQRQPEGMLGEQSTRFLARGRDDATLLGRGGQVLYDILERGQQPEWRANLMKGIATGGKGVEDLVGEVRKGLSPSERAEMAREVRKAQERLGKEDFQQAMEETLGISGIGDPIARIGAMAHFAGTKTALERRPELAGVTDLGVQRKMIEGREDEGWIDTMLREVKDMRQRVNETVRITTEFGLGPGRAVSRWWERKQASAAEEASRIVTGEFGESSATGELSPAYVPKAPAAPAPPPSPTGQVVPAPAAVAPQQHSFNINLMPGRMASLLSDGDLARIGDEIKDALKASGLVPEESLDSTMRDVTGALAAGTQAQNDRSKNTG